MVSPVVGCLMRLPLAAPLHADQETDTWTLTQAQERKLISSRIRRREKRAATLLPAFFSEVWLDS